MIKCQDLVYLQDHSTPLQINSQSIPRLDPIDSKSSYVCNYRGGTSKADACVCNGSRKRSWLGGWEHFSLWEGFETLVSCWPRGHFSQLEGFRLGCVFYQSEGMTWRSFASRTARGDVYNFRTFSLMCSEEDCHFIRASNIKSNLVKRFSYHYKQYHPQITTSHDFTYLVVKS